MDYNKDKISPLFISEGIDREIESVRENAEGKGMNVNTVMQPSMHRCAVKFTKSLEHFLTTNCL